MTNAVFVIPFDGTGISANSYSVLFSICVASKRRPAISNPKTTHVTDEALGSTERVRLGQVIVNTTEVVFTVRNSQTACLSSEGKGLTLSF